MGLNDNKTTLTQLMTGDKPFPEPVLFKFADAYMRHSASVC